MHSLQISPVIDRNKRIFFNLQTKSLLDRGANSDIRGANLHGANLQRGESTDIRGKSDRHSGRCDTEKNSCLLGNLSLPSATYFEEGI